MPNSPYTPDAAQHELVLTRLIDAPRDKLYRCWTEPALIVQWFTPPPWKTIQAQTDVRPGGTSYIVMQGPDGTEMPNRGVYLEVVKNERIVFTDAFTSAWVPSAKPFFTCILSFEDEDGKTRYTARARHWSAEDCAAHEKMGFHAGWGIATDQLAALAATLQCSVGNDPAKPGEPAMNPVVHFEMPFDDRGRMAKFYEKAFGWQTQMLGPEMGDYVLATTTETADGRPKNPGAINGGFFARKPDWPAQTPSIVIAVDDIRAAVKQVADAGGAVLGEPMAIPGVGRYVSFMDTEGNRVSLLQPMPRDAPPATAGSTPPA